MKWRKEIHIEPNKEDFPFTLFSYDDYSSPHWHTYFEMLYILEGQLILNVGSKDHIVKKDDLFVVNAQEIHFSRKYKNYTCSYVVIQFEASLIIPNSKSLFEIKYLLPFLNNKVEHNNYLHVEEKSELKSILDSVISEFMQKDTAYELVIKGNIYRLFAWLIRENFIYVPGTEYSGILPLQKLLIHIDNNYFEEINVREASNMMGMSYSYFSKYFKKVMGKNFITYINYVRIKEAEKLLLTTDKSISEIAYEVGFGSANYFIRTFQKERYISPLQFKRKNSPNK